MGVRRVLLAAAAVAAVTVLTAPWWSRYLLHDGEAVATLPPTGGAVVAGVFPCPPTLADDEFPGGPDELPDGPIAVKACPADDLVSPRIDAPLTTDLDTLVDLVNGQDDIDLGGECPADLGPSYQLAFQYDDGSVQSVEGHHYGCQVTFVGGRQRTGASTVWAAYADLLGAQGGKTPAASLPAGACWPADHSIRATLDHTLPGPEYGTGALCVSDGRDLRSVAIPTDLLTRVTARDPEEPGSCSDGRSSVWAVVTTSWSDVSAIEVDCLTPYGDRLRRLVERATPATIPVPDASTAPEIVLLTFDQLRATGRDDAAARLWIEPDAAELGGSMCEPLLLTSSHQDLDGWEHAVFVDSSCDNGEGWALVRHATTEPWRILRYGAAR